MKRWIVILVIAALVAIIAWPFIFSSGTAEVKGREYTVEHRTSEEGPTSRLLAVHNRAALDAEHAILCSWDRDRYLYSWSDGSRAGFDVAYLDAGGKVLQTGRIRPPTGHEYSLEEVGVASEMEARRALYLPEGSIESRGLGVGDTVKLSSDLLNAKPEPMTAIKVDGKTIFVEISETVRLRSRGLMHRAKMSKGEGMLFLYQAPKPGLNFYMKNTLMSLDIAYFDPHGKLVNVVSAERASNPAKEGAGINAPAQGVAQFVLEVPIGWFRENGLTDDRGKPAKEVFLEITDALKKRLEKAEK